MRIKSISFSLFALVFSMFIFISCADKKSDKNTEKQEVKEAKKSDMAVYQCPMDCEKGKTYHEEGSCPVCKMDLKTADGEGGMNCKQHKDGKCSCKGEKCKCKNCAEHSKAMTCNQHKDGKCVCEGEKCECENCPEHS